MSISGQKKPAENPESARLLIAGETEGRVTRSESQVALEVSHTSPYPLPKDVYGLLLLRIVEISSSVSGLDPPIRAAKLKFAAAVLFYCVYVVLAFGVLGFLVLVVRESMTPWEEEAFSAKHQMAKHELTALLLEKATLGPAPADHPGVSDVAFQTCKMLHEVPRAYIYDFMVFLWTMRMWMEFKSARDWAMNMFLVDTRLDPPQPLMSKDGKGIVQLDKWMKAVVFSFVVTVKLTIFFVTLHIGSCFLMLQNSGFGIVIKVIAMQIVLGIDEQIIDSLALREACSQLGSSYLQIRQVPGVMSKVYWYEGTGAIVFTVVAVLVTQWYTQVRFAALMDLRMACQTYLGTASIFDEAMRTLFSL